MARGWPLSVLLLAAVLVANALSVWGLVSARSDARRIAQAELLLDTEARARALEAALGALRAELAFLATSSPLAGYAEVVGHANPLVARWSRLDAEGSLLLFLEARPALVRLDLLDARGSALARVARRAGAPVLLAPSGALETPPGTWPGRFAGTGGVTLEAWVDPEEVLRRTAPGLEGRLRLGGAGPDPAGGLLARVRFRALDWQPAIEGEVLRHEEESRLLDSVEALAQRYRTAVLLNGAIIGLTLLLGLVALRQTRKNALLVAARGFEAERRELERRLFHSERLSSLGRLAAGLAHEINNPLEGMANYLTLLDDDLRDGRREDAHRHLARVREGLARAAGTVRRVLTFASPDREHAELLDLVGVVAEAVEFVRGNPAYRQVRLELVRPPAPIELSGQRGTLGQLFLNLILNACQVQPEGGEVQVTFATSTQAETTSAVAVHIADRGPGLPPELAGRLFEPFVSARGSTGLGLAVCHGIATAHGGTLEAVNRPDGGARFTVRLPLGGAPSPLREARS
jgi:signal transduction histidine kinase